MESLRFGAASPPQNRFVARSFLAPPPPSTHRISTATYHSPPPPPATCCLAELQKYNNYFTFLTQPASYDHLVQDRPAASMWCWLASSRITTPAATLELGTEEKRKRLEY